MLPKKHLFGSEKKKKEKTRGRVIDKFVLKSVGSHENLDQSNEILNKKIHINATKNNEVNDSSKLNDVPNVSNNENLGMD